MYRNDEDEAAARGEVVYVYVDRDSRRSASIPAPVRDEMAVLVF
ncbi:hypothetical protein ACUTAH_26845 [Metapseudomonas furukawaii]|nr:hypothetical protein [Pseudomonas furukawaii]